MVWGIAFGELLCGGLWGVCCGYVGMRTHFLSINPSFLLRPGVSNECLPIVYLPLRRRVVRSPEKGARDSPRHARALPRTDEEVTPTPHHRWRGMIVNRH